MKKRRKTWGGLHDPFKSFWGVEGNQKEQRSCLTLVPSQVRPPLKGAQHLLEETDRSQVHRQFPVHIFFLNNFYLLTHLFDCAGSLVLQLSLVAVSRGHSRIVVLRRGGFSCFWAGTLGCEALSSSGSQALEHRLSSCGARVYCSVACGIFPDQGLGPCLLYGQADSLPRSHQGSPQSMF